MRFQVIGAVCIAGIIDRLTELSKTLHLGGRPGTWLRAVAASASSSTWQKKHLGTCGVDWPSFSSSKVTGVTEGMNLAIRVLPSTHPFLQMLTAIWKKPQFKTSSPTEPGKSKVQAWRGMKTFPKKPAFYPKAWMQKISLFKNLTVLIQPPKFLRLYHIALCDPECPNDIFMGSVMGRICKLAAWLCHQTTSKTRISEKKKKSFSTKHPEFFFSFL